MGNKDALVSEEMAAKFATEKDTPYTRWVRSEGLDIIGAHYVPNLYTVDLKPWARRGGRGVFMNHEASRTSNDCYVCEIAPAGKLATILAGANPGTSTRATNRSSSVASACRSASANVNSSSTDAGATSNSTSSTTGERSSASSRAAGRNPS